MKALQMTRYGVPQEVVELVDLPEPEAPKADEVLAAVEYAPINHSEILKITQRYPLLPAAGLFALPSGADPRQLSMISINPPTAALLLSEYVDLQPGEWVIQNAGNSGVGRSVIAVAKSRGLRTVSVVRRPELIDELREQRGDVVLVQGPDFAASVAKETANAKIRLALDRVCGGSTAALPSSL